MRQYLTAACTICLLLIAGCTAAPPAASTATPPTVGPATSTATPAIGGELVSIGERALFLACSGSGSPTVILEAGLGGDHTTWARVQPAIARFTRVCSYDRAGLGQSDPAPVPRSSADVAADLDALLEHAQIDGPYVLIAHSFGGLHARVFAAQRPHDIAGLVLVDAVHEEWWERALKLLPPPGEADSARLRSFRTFLQQGMRDPANNVEGIDIPASVDQVRQAGTLGSIPLIVLVAGTPDAIAPGLPAEVEARLQRLLSDELPTALAALSSDSARVVVPASGHAMPIEQPDVIVVAAHSVVEAYRQRAE